MDRSEETLEEFLLGFAERNGNAAEVNGKCSRYANLEDFRTGEMMGFMETLGRIGVDMNLRVTKRRGNYVFRFYSVETGKAKAEVVVNPKGNVLNVPKRTALRNPYVFAVFMRCFMPSRWKTVSVIMSLGGREVRVRWNTVTCVVCVEVSDRFGRVRMPVGIIASERMRDLVSAARMYRNLSPFREDGAQTEESAKAFAKALARHVDGKWGKWDGG